MPTMFDVTPEELKNSASKISTMESEWIKEVNTIYAAVNELNVSYKGEVSETFTKQLEGYQNDFEAAKKALTEYVDFLTNYASDIQKTEEELKQQASQLSVGY